MVVSPKSSASFSLYRRLLAYMEHQQIPDNGIVAALAQGLLQPLTDDEQQSHRVESIHQMLMTVKTSIEQFPSKASSVEVVNNDDWPRLQMMAFDSQHYLIVVQPLMPFVIDSVRHGLNRVGVARKGTLAATFGLRGTPLQRQIELSINTPDTKDSGIVVLLMEIEPLSELQQQRALAELTLVFEELYCCVRDWEAMRNQLLGVITALEQGPCVTGSEEQQHTLAFLRLLAEHHFTFMGYRYYRFHAKADESGLALPVERLDDCLWVGCRHSSLGLMRVTESADKLPQEDIKWLSELPENGRKQALEPNYLLLTKTQRQSRIHRPAYCDYVGIKCFNASGELVGEHCFIGLYGAPIYYKETEQLPWLSRKVHQVLRLTGLACRHHDYRALGHVLETFPRDELLQAPIAYLYRTATAIVNMRLREHSQSFIRQDQFGHFIMVLVFTPRDHYHTAVRQQTQRLLAHTFNTQSPISFNSHFSESYWVRTEYVVLTEPGQQLRYNESQLQRQLHDLTKSWQERLSEQLHQHYGVQLACKLSQRFIGAFSMAYQSEQSIAKAIFDIEQLRQLASIESLRIRFLSSKSQHQIRVYRRHQSLTLSAVMPMLEDFGIVVLDQRPYEIQLPNEPCFWVLVFNVKLPKAVSDANSSVLIKDIGQRFEHTFSQVFHHELSSDPFNELVFAAHLYGQEVNILRAYVHYWRQLGGIFETHYVAQVLIRYPQLAASLLNLFHLRFDPMWDGETKSERGAMFEGQVVQLQQQIQQQAQGLNEDRALRQLLAMLQATVRTNYYQTATNPLLPLAFKLCPSMLAECPYPKPLYEIFVFSTQIEGVHLRYGLQARGGIRWSERPNDYRMEVLGLCKAQQVKNALIVPVGAKGGFICQRLAATGEARFKGIADGYERFINGLLSLTDNRVGDRVTSAESLIVYDQADPYFVVAADKGTSRFSDRANAIALAQGFWLGDAFASGGTHGYDHKRLGITARGAWLSVESHCQQLHLDIENEGLSCIGIGDMSGDVFGNGMLLSASLRLVAAFDHRHIFIDPSPEPAISYQARLHLFQQPHSNWNDYDQQALSAGGGVFCRNAKIVPLSNEIKQLLNCSESHLTPEQLIKKLLQLPVDLLWNGGIGTYVKASFERHHQLGDPANDALRIDANQLKVQMVCEGGNLGLSPQARIEYALNGGVINADFIDNAAGVVCSDREVNLKVLLDLLVKQQQISLKQRNRLLTQLTAEVTESVLQDCQYQTLGLSVAAAQALANIKLHQWVIQQLERTADLERSLMALPTDEQIHQRIRQEQGLTRPEIAIVHALMKIHWNTNLSELLPQTESNEALQTILAPWLYAYFPTEIRDKWPETIMQHPLAKPIIATRISNALVDLMGAVAMSQLQYEFDLNLLEVMRAGVIAMHLCDAEQYRQQALADNTNVIQHMILLQQTLLDVSRWLLQAQINQQPQIKVSESQADLTLLLPHLLACWHRYKGLEPPSVNPQATLPWLEFGLEVLELKQQSTQTVLQCGEMHLYLWYQLTLDQLIELVLPTYFIDDCNKQAFIDFKYRSQNLHRQLTLSVLSSFQMQPEQEIGAIFTLWQEKHAPAWQRWQIQINRLKASSCHEIAKMLSILRELHLLVVKCERA
ncbi:MAG: NAD-glutamate dehydrogenase [Ferrimonas sp.]